MVTFIIVRHGFSQFNQERKFTGQMDIPLTAAGLEQALQTAEYVLKTYSIDAVYSSDLCRAVDTAKPIAEALGLPIRTSKSLREMNLGVWQGMGFDEVKEKFPEKYAIHRENVGESRPTGGENYAELTERALNELHRIALENDGKTVLIATHGGLVRALRCAWLSIPLSEMKNVSHVTNASVTVAEYDAATRTAKLPIIGYDNHLGNKATEWKLS